MTEKTEKPKKTPKAAKVAAVAKLDGDATKVARLQKMYVEEVSSKMQEKFGYKNVMEIPRITKIVINMGVGEATTDSKTLDAAVVDLTAIAGQKPVKTVSGKSIAGFKIRTGLPIGCKVTLRKKRMYEFLDRFVNIALPRVKDFRGITGKCFDGRGNFSMGLKEQLVFPEINYDKIDKIRGMNICIVTTAKTNEEAKELLKGFSMPFAA